MNMLSGRTPPTAGDALIFGYSIKNHSAQLKKKLGICPQVLDIFRIIIIA